MIVAFLYVGAVNDFINGNHSKNRWKRIWFEGSLKLCDNYLKLSIECVQKGL